MLETLTGSGELKILQYQKLEAKINFRTRFVQGLGLLSIIAAYGIFIRQCYFIRNQWGIYFQCFKGQCFLLPMLRFNLFWLIEPLIFVLMSLLLIFEIVYTQHLMSKFRAQQQQNNPMKTLLKIFVVFVIAYILRASFYLYAYIDIQSLPDLFKKQSQIANVVLLLAQQNLINTFLDFYWCILPLGLLLIYQYRNLVIRRPLDEEEQTKEQFTTNRTSINRSDRTPTLIFSQNDNDIDSTHDDDIVQSLRSSELTEEQKKLLNPLGRSSKLIQYNLVQQNDENTILKRSQTIVPKSESIDIDN